MIKQASSYHGNNSMASFSGNKVIVDIDSANDVNHHPFFYNRVKSEMIAKYLEGCLTIAALKQLNLRRSIFVWTDKSGEKITDGLSMLKTVIDKINLLIRVGIKNILFITFLTPFSRETMTSSAK